MIAHLPKLPLVSVGAVLLIAFPAAALLLYVNLVVAATFVQTSNGNLIYVALPIAFAALAIGAPVVGFRRSIRRDQSVGRSVRRAVLACLILNVLVLPISVGAMSM